MMNNPYDLQSWSTQYRQEWLAESRKRTLAEQARTSREPRESGWLDPVWMNPLALLRGA